MAATVKIPLWEAEEIFNAYHNEMYPGITEYRENYVLKKTKETGRLHLGLGFYINTDNPDRDIRTTNNASAQFWSILTALAINKMHALIDEAGLENDVIITSTIYDSIFFEIRNDPNIIKWVNDRIVPIMEQDFMLNQLVHNEARLEIGKNWADRKEIEANMSLSGIRDLMLRNQLI